MITTQTVIRMFFCFYSVCCRMRTVDEGEKEKEKEKNKCYPLQDNLKDLLSSFLK